MIKIKDTRALLPSRPAEDERGFCQRIESTLVYAFQPIVDIHSGGTFAFEALMRGHEALGFADPAALLAEADRLGCMPRLEMVLREKAIARFMAISQDDGQGGSGEASGFPARLFFNTGIGFPFGADREARSTVSLLRRHGLPASRFCLEITETQRTNPDDLAAMLREWPERPLLAMDDFGVGFSGLKSLFEIRPDFVKVDRFFVSGIDGSGDRKLFLSQIVGLAHSLGILVVAEGIETEEEFRVCREIGCDLAQGYLIARPSTEQRDLVPRYDLVPEINRLHRSTSRERQILMSEIQRRLPLRIDEPIQAAVEAFRIADHLAYLPVVDAAGFPLGLVHERRLRHYVYSPYGRDVLANRATGLGLRDFVTPCLTCDIGIGFDDLLGAAATRADDTAVLIVERQTYVGLLDAQSIIRAMHERKLSVASEQNPLTKLAGNLQIVDFITEKIETDGFMGALIYFDFDYFKPFNDMMGFRQGDRVILMFAELLRRHFDGPGRLLGHVGGDDFFLGLTCGTTDCKVETLRERLLGLIQQFARDTEAFYPPEIRGAGQVTITGRDDELRAVPLLSVSCGCLLVSIVRSPSSPAPTMDTVSARLADLKRLAKKDPSRLAIGTLA